MSPEAIKEKITAIQPDAVFEEGTELLTLQTGPEGFRPFMEQMRRDTDVEMDYLFCLTAVDWKTHYTVVYHLTSTKYRHVLVVKVKLDKADPAVDTVSDIWRTAEFHEREAYDLMGISFTGHPDLRRLFLSPDHVGYPLRKDYEDPVNMIKL
jgi:NADH:ubiquinone oxidoreductase subunit C